MLKVTVVCGLSLLVIQLVSEHRRRHLRSSSYRTLAVPRTRTALATDASLSQDRVCGTVYRLL